VRIQAGVSRAGVTSSQGGSLESPEPSEIRASAVPAKQNSFRSWSARIAYIPRMEWVWSLVIVALILVIVLWLARE
jgi:hypothetical protein